jgi:hypothetical protein
MLGRTLRNDGGGEPGAESPEVIAGRLERRVEGWLEDDLARLRAVNGMVDDYFGKMRAALEREAGQMAAPVQHDLLGSLAHGAAEFARTWSDAVRLYGATGNPYIEQRTPPGAPESPLERAARLSPGSPQHELAEKLEQGARLRDLGDGKLGAGLLAILEVRQAGDGRLLEARLLSPSGNARFDAHVLASGPSAVERLAPPPERGMGIHEGGLRSQWEFRGQFVYARKVSELSAGELLALAPMGPLSLLTGKFEETTGEIFVLHPGAPQFRCRVRLLRLY